MEEAGAYIMTDKPRQQVVQTVKEYGLRLFQFIRKRVKTNEEAEDILQDVWFQLSNIADFDTIEHVSGWLYQVARNKITDQYRKKKPDSLEDLFSDDSGEESDFQNFLAAETFAPEMDSLKEMFWEELFRALDELPENQRQVFVLNELEGVTLQQIADRSGENLKTIISRKGYAVKHLRKRLEDLYSDLLNF